MNRSAIHLPVSLAILAAACAASAPATVASSSPATPSDPVAAPVVGPGGVYSESQAARGREAFRRSCVDCHYSSEFRGTQFQFAWGRRSVADLYVEIVRNMPEDAPGSLSSQVYVDIVAYILQLNGFPAGAADLPADEDVLERYRLAAPTGAGPSQEVP